MGFSRMNLSFSLPFLIHAIALLLYLNSAISVSAAGGNKTDVQALLEFKAQITHDPFGILSSWNGTNHFCQWHGIRCARRHQRVRVLDLQSLKLEGSISPYVGNLSFLRELNLQNNSFTHEIPLEIGHLQRLKDLNLNNNSINGKIPNISSCSNLIAIRFRYNQLEGDIPMELGALSKLQVLEIEHNNLTGNIPHFLGNLSHLHTLILAYNCLSGDIPDSLGQLTKLTVLGFFSNRLSGVIPPSIFNLSSITKLNFAYSHLQGDLPPELFISLPNLSFFSIASNQITGSIPVSITNASNLEILLLLDNKIAGKVPCMEKLQKLKKLCFCDNYLGNGGANDMIFLSSLTNASMLTSVSIAANNFGGLFPEKIANFSTKLIYLGLSDNQIYGSIPSGIDNLINLQFLDISENKLSGIIPTTIGKLRNLVKLHLHENKFSGVIPDSIGNLTNLIGFVIRENNVHGSIPSILCQCKYLISLDLSENNFTGAIPPQLMGLSSLSIVLDLSDNYLTGIIPSEIGNLKNLVFLDLSENMLSGQIPSTLGSCVVLETLGMSGNFLQGPIPSSLGSLRSLHLLDLSHNNLSGEIPEFLSRFGMLLHLNLSYNNFEGMVPIHGVFKDASAISIKGVARLCGGIPELQLPACNSKRPTKSRLKALSVIFELLGITLVMIGIFLFWLKQKRKHPSPSNHKKDSFLELSYGSLFKATGGFSLANMVGAGSFGSVYKGTLEEGGQLIAVKVLNLLHHGAFKSFKAECEALRNIRHRNLVKVLTACSSVDYHGNDFKALVYEFMVNGSLEEWLHPAVDTADQAEMATRSLSLLQRLNIAIDVADALVYLHRHCEIPIAHCDIKPSNILLDEEMTGRVGDFGLARLLREGNHGANIAQSSSIGARGTVGYAPPEYGMGNEVSPRGDVYSYGIVLLEMLTGKRPTDGMFNEGDNIHNFVKTALREHVAQIVDPVLFLREAGETSSCKPRSATRNQRTLQCMISILGIGVACSTEQPSERMSIDLLVDQLILVRDKLLGNRTRGERPNSSTSNQQR